MTAPVIRQYPGTIPDKGQAQTEFDTNVDGWLDWTTLQFAPDLVAFGTWADGVRASLIAGNLPPLTGRNLDAVRVNAAGNDVEFADVTAAGWELLADVDPEAQRTTLGLIFGTTVPPIDSPIFTGNVRAPTVATSTNSTQIATTAFVKAAAHPLAIVGAGVGEFVSISAPVATALSLPAGGTWIYFLLLINAAGGISGHESNHAAGGSTIYGGAGGIQTLGWAWRKA